jgi:hypothetical protein
MKLTHCVYKTQFGFSKPNSGFQNTIWVFKTQFGFSKHNLGFQNSIRVFKTQFGFSNVINTDFVYPNFAKREVATLI